MSLQGSSRVYAGAHDFEKTKEEHSFDFSELARKRKAVEPPELVVYCFRALRL